MSRLNKSRKLFILILFVLSAFVFLLGIQESYAKAPVLKAVYGQSAWTEDGDLPILKIVPEQSNWIADGTTLYKITIIGDSRPMNPSGTRGIQFEYFLPEAQGYTFNLVNMIMRPQNDFFAGWSTIDNHAGGTIGRVLGGSGTGPINLEGNVVDMWFSVSKSGNGPGYFQTRLGFNPDPEITYFLRPTSQGGAISPVIESIPFYVMSEEYALGNSCRSSWSQAAAC